MMKKNGVVGKAVLASLLSVSLIPSFAYAAPVGPESLGDQLSSSEVEEGSVPSESVDGVVSGARVDEGVKSGDSDEGVGDPTGISDERSDDLPAESDDSVDSPTPASDELVYYQNDQGEYAYVPSESLSSDDLPAEVTPFAASSATVVELGGDDRYETVAKEAQYAFASSDTAVVASGVGYADSIAASSLAGALDCPILLTNSTFVPEVTKGALEKLGVRNVILIGSTSVANANVEKSLRSITGGSVTRLWGSDRYETQMKIYQYGMERNLWNGDYAIIAAATGFADALSISPVSYSLKIPVFFCDATGYLPSAQEKALKNEYKAKNILITGSTVVVSSKAEKFAQGLSSARGGKTARLAGADRYKTSQAIAQYAVKNLGFSWNGVAFASGQGPYDSLGGGVVQGKEKSVLLLADAVNSDAANAIKSSGGSVGSGMKFFGSTVVVPGNVRSKICVTLGVSYYQGVTFTSYNISRSTMAQLQVDRKESNSYKYGDFYSALNPDQHTYGTSAYYQFAVLNNGYSGVSAGSLNGYVSSNCMYQEQNYGRKSNLRNAGQYFVNAAKATGINETYLLAHAIWESAWGCSELATGWTPTKNGTVVVNGKSYPYYKGTTYYNFYGIGAYDSNALSGGRAMAVKEGWTSPEKAILGAAKWISSNYADRGYPGDQNTLYLMKWDVAGAAATGDAWHEYCTGLDTWVLGISRLMNSCYLNAGKSFESTGLRFDVPSYSSN